MSLTEISSISRRILDKDFTVVYYTNKQICLVSLNNHAVNIILIIDYMQDKKDY